MFSMLELEYGIYKDEHKNIRKVDVHIIYLEQRTEGWNIVNTTIGILERFMFMFSM